MRKAFTIGVLALTALCAAGLLHASFSAFTWKKYGLFDYGVYTNWIWNSGQGDFFRVLVDRSYLKTHLSFSLVPVGVLFRLWDHPFLLALFQWLLLLGGAGMLGAALRRRGASAMLTSAFLFFYVAYPFSQSVVLSEFHGVSTYLLLVPWLYFFLGFHRGLAWLPLLLILGLREDAFLVVLPMVLYFAIRDRWKGGYVYAAGTLAYGILAIFVLYPHFNEISLFQRRASEIHAQIGWEELADRARALVWVFLPTLVFVGRRWLPVMIFPSVAIVTAMAGGFYQQYQLNIHYPAAIMACLAVGMAEAATFRGKEGDSGVFPRAKAVALWLVAVTFAGHIFLGFLPGGGRSDRVYRRIHPDGIELLRAAENIPREGTLVVPMQLAGFVANRANLLSWRTYREKKHTIDLIFSNLQLFAGNKAQEWLNHMNDGEFGVRYFDGTYFVLERGFDTSRNEELKEARILARSTVRLANTLSQAGTDIEVPGALSVRYWEGSAEGLTPLVVYGRYKRLPPGAYEARLRLRAAKPAGDENLPWGSITIGIPGGGEPLVKGEIEREETPVGTFRIQVLRFELAETVDVETIIRGGAAPLWLNSLVYAPAGENGDPGKSPEPGEGR